MSDDPVPPPLEASASSGGAAGGHVAEPKPVSSLPDAKRRNIVFVLDESGSMYSEANVRNGSVVEKTGLNFLNLVVLATTASIKSMSAENSVGCVMFSDSATMLFDIISMTDANKDMAKKALMLRKPMDNTNILQGIEMAMNMLAKRYRAYTNQETYHIVMLTDGIPSDDANGAHVRRIAESIHKDFNPEVTVFGFGYGVKIEICEEIAITMGGHYVGVPSPDMIATNFAAYVARMIANDPPIQLDPIVERFRISLIDKLREMVRLVRIGRDKAALDLVGDLSTNIRATMSSMVDDVPKQMLHNLLKDVEGQIAIALSKTDYMQTWGVSYLLSLARAHELKICANYKDQGPMNYAGQDFKMIQDRVLDVFRAELAEIQKKIIADAATNAARGGGARAYGGGYGGGGGGGYGGGVAAATAAAAAAENLANVRGGCVDAECMVLMADGTRKPAKFIKRADKVRSINDSIGEVIEISITKISPALPMIVFKTGLKITEYHPILSDKWIFPINAPFDDIARRGPAALCDSEFVYSFAVRGIHNEPPNVVHGMIVGDILVATLGHEVANDSVLTHPFYGTREVLDDIASMNAACLVDGTEPIIGTNGWTTVYEGTMPIGIKKLA